MCGPFYFVAELIVVISNGKLHGSLQMSLSVHRQNPSIAWLSHKSLGLVKKIIVVCNAHCDCAHGFIMARCPHVLRAVLQSLGVQSKFN